MEFLLQGLNPVAGRLRRRNRTNARPRPHDPLDLTGRYRLPYTLKRRGNTGQDMRRIARGQIDHTLEEPSQASHASGDTVHQVRR